MVPDNGLSLPIQDDDHEDVAVLRIHEHVFEAAGAIAVNVFDTSAEQSMTTEVCRRDRVEV